MQTMDCFASIVWLIMRGDAVASEFLAALTASQVTHVQQSASRSSPLSLHLSAQYSWMTDQTVIQPKDITVNPLCLYPVVCLHLVCMILRLLVK